MKISRRYEQSICQGTIEKDPKPQKRNQLLNVNCPGGKSSIVLVRNIIDVGPFQVHNSSPSVVSVNCVLKVQIRLCI